MMFSVLNSRAPSNLALKRLFDNSALLELQHQAERLDTAHHAEQILLSRRAGNLATKAPGSGNDYAESRLYQPGDDIRSINWRLSARTQDTFVKTFHIESRPTINLLLDRRRSMLFGTRHQLKDTLALRLAFLLAFASEFHQLDFHAWVVSDHPKSIKHYDDRYTFIEQENHPPALSETPSKINLQRLLVDMVELRPQGSLYFLISDFMALDDTLLPELVQLTAHGYTQAIHIVDPAEIQLPDCGRVKLQGLFSTQNISLDTHVAKDADLFTGHAQQSLATIQALLNQAGSHYHQLMTDTQDLSRAFMLPLGIR